MYRLLIVEDEKWEREGLRDFLDWNSLGIEVAGCACNGAEGVKMAELYRPQIILTDIMMPKMDGIQMSLKVRTFLPDVRIIVLSGYDDFQYAKQTFEFHAYAYLLKPIEKKQIEEVISGVLKVLDREKNENGERDALKNQFGYYIRMNRDRILLDLLESRVESGYTPELLPIVGLRTQGKKIAAILSLYRDAGKAGSFERSFDCFNPEGLTALARMLNERGIAFSFSKPYREAVLCMEAPATQLELETELLQLIDNLKKEFKVDAIISIGDVVEDFSGAARSYVQAKEAGSYRFLAEYGDLLFYQKMKEMDQKDLDKVRPLILRTNGIIKKILYGTRKSGTEEICILVEDFLSVLKENPSISKMLLSGFFTEAVNSLTMIQPLDYTVLESLSQTRQHLMTFLKTMSVDTVVDTADKKSFNDDEVAKKVIRIIEEKYAEDLDLKRISKEIHLTPYYIGSIFKKYTGKQFSQYLNEYRIDKAKEILETQKVKVCHLADAVGVRNPSYFGALFKSRFGLSPGDYKEILKGRQDYV